MYKFVLFACLPGEVILMMLILYSVLNFLNMKLEKLENFGHCLSVAALDFILDLDITDLYSISMILNFGV